MRLDIVLPCYNPQPGWSEEIIQSWKEIAAHLQDVSVRIILVNDGSSKGIEAEDIQALRENISGFQFINRSINQGKGYTLREGIARSDAPMTIFTDVDFPYTTDSLLALYRLLSEGGCDIAVGIKDEAYYQKLPAMRVRISRFLRFLSGIFLKMSITDTQCGLKGFNEKGKAVFMRTTIKRYLADLEFIFLADHTSGIRMRPLTVHLREHVVFSKVNSSILLTEGLNFFQVWLRSWRS